jgi:uncharacterized membrane protein YjjB (DUF3815 family)
MSLISLLQPSLWAATASVAFAIAFNVPRRGLAACGLIAALGFFARGSFVALHLGSLELATLLASMLVTLLAMVFGRLLHDPALIFAVPGVIPFVPGALALRATRGAIALVAGSGAVQPAESLDSVITAGIKALLIIGALAGGVAIPSLLFRHRRPLT